MKCVLPTDKPKALAETRLLKFLCRLENPYGKQTYQLSTSKLQGLGFKFRGLEEMFDDCVQSLKDQGHLLECPL